MQQLLYSIQRYLPIFSLFFLLGCSENSEIQTSEKTVGTKNRPTSLRFETFTQFPKDIDGCSCYFSKDSTDFKKKKYIFLDNFENIAYIKIKSRMVRLTRTKTEEFSDFSVKTAYTNEEFDLVIKIYEGNSSGEETWMNFGEITLTKKSGEQIITNFYGECGC